MSYRNIFFPKKSHNGYFDKALQQHFYSKTQKAEYMKAHGIVEDGSMESQRHRDKRLCEEINEARRKQGLKPKLVSELIGDSRQPVKFTPNRRG